MQETETDVQALQQILDQSIEQAGSFLRSAFQMPNCSLSARQLIKYFAGVQTVALATVTAKGEPRVAPIGALMYRGVFYVPTLQTAVRTQHLRNRPGVSLSHYVGTDLAVIVHGHAVLIQPEVWPFEELQNLQRGLTGQGVQDWGDGLYLQINANMIYTFARHPETFLE